jgi:hypothetical protein
VWKFSSVAYTWYVLIGACVTILMGAAVSRLMKDEHTENLGSAQVNG